MLLVFLSCFSILYQRGIYPSDSFKREQFYDLTLFVSDDKDLQDYLSKVLQQLKGRQEIENNICNQTGWNEISSVESGKGCTDFDIL